MIPYIIQVAAFQLVFLMIYDAFLKKETFFNWNRIYLLATALLSVVIPFIRLEVFKNAIPQQYIINLPEVVIGNAPTSQNAIQLETVVIESKPFWTWENVLYAGIIFATLLFVFKIAKVIWMLIKNPKSKFGNLLIISLLNSNAAFSFFHYIFLGDHLNETDKEAILKHEMVHVKEKHTFDLLFFEVMRILFWFNPLVYMYQNRIMTLHEFIADQQAVKHQNKAQYYQNLLSQVFQTQKISFINPFFKQSLIKKRIVMLQKSKSKQVKLFKYALLIPIVFGMLVYTSSFAQNEQSGVENNQNKNDEELVSNLIKEYNSLKDSEVDFKNITHAFFTKSDMYILTKEQYYRSNIYLMEISGKSIDNSTFFSNLRRTYAEYLEWLKTDEAKEIWENNTSDGILKQVVNDLNNLTDEEKQKKEHKLSLLLKDDFFTEFIITDGKSYININLNGSKINNDEKIEIEVPYAVVDEAPVILGCEDLASNEEKKKCTSNRIQEFVGRNFNTNIASENGLVGRQRITTMFKIDTEGNIVDVKSRAPHPVLEAETIRVIKLLPKMQPGKQRGEPVVVPYSLPIVFVAQNDEPELEKK